MLPLPSLPRWGWGWGWGALPETCQGLCPPVRAALKEGVPLFCSHSPRRWSAHLWSFGAACRVMPGQIMALMGPHTQST